ncbi:MAG: LuxR family transcriptional regulator [Pseudomonadota bacterium]
MSERMESIVGILSDATSDNDLSALVGHVRDLYDVDHVVYHRGGPGQDETNLFTYNPDWVLHYIKQGYRRIDPVYQTALRGWLPFEWDRLNWAGKTETSFLSEALDGGVAPKGYSIPIQGPRGSFAMLSFNAADTPEGWDRRLREFKQDFLLLSHYVHERAESLRELSPSTAKELSPRERDVLTLLGLGHSRAQAADQLQISEHTFRVYVDTARHKLGALNTTHAVAVALNSGAIAI